MDWIDIKTKVISLFREYKYVVLILIVGVILMLLPTAKKEESSAPIVISQEESNQIMLQDSLEAILSTLDGAGKVRVLLTQSQGEKIIYKTDIRMREDETEESTIIISGTGKEQRGLISQVIPPQYKGAVILCQGADNATIRLAIVKAVSSATGLSTDKITVLKMK